MLHLPASDRYDLGGLLLSLTVCRVSILLSLGYHHIEKYGSSQSLANCKRLRFDLGANLIFLDPLAVALMLSSTCLDPNNGKYYLTDTIKPNAK